jgi:antitoxin (DNA-binding transcriptional repressor) of toxin-antitoxin stability system
LTNRNPQFTVFSIMKVEISTTKAARNFGDCLARIRHTGDVFVLTKNHRPVAELSPVVGARNTRLERLWRVMREMPVDPDFARDLERVNASDTVANNPWP